jgi:hypothetical protein
MVTQPDGLMYYHAAPPAALSTSTAPSEPSKHKGKAPMQPSMMSQQASTSQLPMTPITGVNQFAELVNLLCLIMDDDLPVSRSTSIADSCNLPVPVRGLHHTRLTTRVPVVVEEGKIPPTNQLAIDAPDSKGQDIKMGDN